MTTIMGAQRAAKAGRDIVAYFAGHLANLANGNDTLGGGEEIVASSPSTVRAGPSLLTVNKRYAEGLVGVWAYPPPDNVEDAADFYFDRVIDRPIAARRGEPTSADNLAALVGEPRRRPGAPRRRATDAASIWKALVGGPPRRRRFRGRASCSNFPTASSNASTPPTAPMPKCCGSGFARRNGWSATTPSASTR